MFIALRHVKCYCCVIGSTAELGFKSCLLKRHHLFSKLSTFTFRDVELVLRVTNVTLRSLCLLWNVIVITLVKWLIFEIFKFTLGVALRALF